MDSILNSQSLASNHGQQDLFAHFLLAHRVEPWRQVPFALNPNSTEVGSLLGKEMDGPIESSTAATAGPAVPNDLCSRSTDPQDDPWRPIVLSLDGGGIRGLSSLYIIREIMMEIKRLKRLNTEHPTAIDSTSPGEPSNSGGGSVRGTEEDLPLPCHYFDFMIGTSTGGLIAIMLGRLRMDINQCIEEYKKLGNSIFRPQSKTPLRYLSKRFQYSPDKVREAVEDVISNYCRCSRTDKNTCINQYLRQSDYAEENKFVDKRLVNKTCKVAVVTLREGGGNSESKGNPGDVPYLFRTYNHSPRSGPFSGEWNPRILDRSTLTIVEACRATSAAPTWFPHVKLRGRKFIDGGVTDHNNPAWLAWDEANEMAHRPGDQKDLRRIKGPRVLLSVGTGKTKQPRRFGLYNLILLGKNKLTDTEAMHVRLEPQLKREECEYWRFNVPESDLSLGKKGLDTIKLDRCKKVRKRPLFSFTRPTVIPPEEDISQSERSSREDKKGGYKPHKYEYRTYDKIWRRTLDYCGPDHNGEDGNVFSEIQECANWLYDLSQQRRNINPERWSNFQEHPDPHWIPSRNTAKQAR